MQTIYAAKFMRAPVVNFRRERWDTPDGDFIDLDWTQSSILIDDSTPCVVLFHGLEGGSRSHYARTLMHAVSARGWRGVVVHFRGCSGEPNRKARAYHSGDSVEIDWILRRLHTLDRSIPLHACGVSLGGNALLKWLGEQGADAREIVASAAAVSAPLDLMAAGDALGRGFNMLYTRNFLTTLKAKSLAKLKHYAGIYNARQVLAARTLRDFDNVVTAPLHGFRDTDDYWTRASSKPALRNIAVRTLLLNARNDPFMPESALPTNDEVSQAITAEFPLEGGHAGFVTGPFPGRIDWLAYRLLAHASAE
jgi:uncharacterized protein